MFETLNSILSTDVLRYSLMMGTGALMAYTLWPLPSAMDTFASSSILKFGTLFLFGLLAAYPINLSKFMILFFAALLIMILFEYLRQVDKGLSTVPAAKAAVKEFMWDNPIKSYSAEAPYADPRMGIPQYLPDGVTPAVTYVGDAGGMSNTGDFRVPAEQFMNPIAASFVELRDLSTKGLNTLADASRDMATSVGLRDKEKYENRIRTALLQIRDISQQMGRNIAANMGMVDREQFANPLQAAFLEVRNVSQQGLHAASQMGRNIAASIGFASKERLANPLQDIFNQMKVVSKRGIDMVTGAVGLRESRESFENPLQGITQRGLHAATQFGRSIVSAAGLNPEYLFNPLDSAFVLPTKALGVLVPGLP